MSDFRFRFRFRDLECLTFDSGSDSETWNVWVSVPVPIPRLGMSDFRFRDRFRDKTWTESLGISVPGRENRESLLSKTSNQPEAGYLNLILATKRITPCERVLKTVLNGVFSCVPFSLRSLGQFERCAAQRSRRKDLIFHYPLKMEWINIGVNFISFFNDIP